MADALCLSIRFVPGLAEKVASIVYGKRDDSKGEIDKLLAELAAFVRGLDLDVTTIGATTMCVRGTPAQFAKAFNTKAPEAGWSDRTFQQVDQRALDAVAARLPQYIQDIALQRSFSALATAGDWPPPAPGQGCLGLLDEVPLFLGVDRIPAGSSNGAGIEVTIFDSDFAFDHSFFVERRVRCSQRLAVAGDSPATDVQPSGHGTAMAALVAAIAPGADVVGMKLRNGVLLEGLNAALDPTAGSKPDVMSISLTKDMCDRASGTCWTELPRDLEHIAAEIDLAVANGIVVVVGTGNGDYGFPAAMKQVIAVGGVQVGAGMPQVLMAWDGASAFRSQIKAGDCKNRFVPDVCALAGNDRGAYIVLPVPPGSAFEREFPLSASGVEVSGWALFSGTSAATAQVAGVCALVLQKKRLAPRELKNLLCNTARGVSEGSASPLSNLPNEVGLLANADRDRAAGSGLVDAFEAWLRATDEDWTRDLRGR